MATRCRGTFIVFTILERMRDDERLEGKQSHKHAGRVKKRQRKRGRTCVHGTTGWGTGKCEHEEGIEREDEEKSSESERKKDRERETRIK